MGFGMGKATAGQIVKVDGKQISGGAIWMAAGIHGILLDA